MARSLLHDELSYRIRGRRHTSKSKNGHGHRQNRRHPARCHRIIVFGCTTNSASRHSKSLARILSTAPLQRNLSAQHHLLLLALIITLGGITVVAYFRSQSPLDCEFATHKIHGKVQPFLDAPILDLPTHKHVVVLTSPSCSDTLYVSSRERG